MKPQSISDILISVSDDTSLVLLDTIAGQPSKTEVLIRTSKLTKKGYYLRISKLTDSGIVARKRGKYQLTSFGRAAYEAQKLIRKAVENRRKLAAIDSIESTSLYNDHKLPTEERNRIIDTLMEGNDDIKEILLGSRK
jgi:predicted transcriptional regulator